MPLSQLGLRTIVIDLPGLWPTSLPEASFLTMYGPMNATCWS